MPKAVDLALEILTHIEEVEDPFRDQLVGNFKDPQNIETMTPQAFLERFGLALKNYQKNDSGFWENFKSRFQTIFKK